MPDERGVWYPYRYRIVRNKSQLSLEPLRAINCVICIGHNSRIDMAAKVFINFIESWNEPNANDLVLNAAVNELHKIRDDVNIYVQQPATAYGWVLETYGILAWPLSAGR